MRKRTILVTGASSGIGRAVAERLLAQHHSVIAIARNFSRIDPIADQNFHPCTMDLSDLEGLPDRIAELATRFPRLDGLVCNAGQGRFGSLEEFSYDQIGALVDLNLTSQIFLVRGFLTMLKRSPSSDIVLMGSESALTGGRRGVVYASTKSALRGFARALRDEASRSGVRVSLVNPGAVRTGFYENAPFRPGSAAENAISPEEVADAVCSILGSRPGVVFDEVNLSPLKKVLDFGPGKH